MNGALKRYGSSLRREVGDFARDICVKAGNTAAHRQTGQRQAGGKDCIKKQTGFFQREAPLREFVVSSILVINLNPTFQRTISLPRLDRGEVNRASLARLDIAGKGVNTARVIQQLGGDVRLITHLGSERNILLNFCARENLSILWEASEARIRTCVTLLETATGEMTEIIEPSDPVEEDVVRRINALAAKEIENTDWLILTGTRAPGYPENLFAGFCRLAHEKGVKVAVDFQGPELLECLKIGIHTVKINLVEFTRTFLPEYEAKEAEDRALVKPASQAMRELSQGEGCAFVVTRGRRDVLFAQEGHLHTLRPPPVKAVNTIGSGDAFMAGMTFALAGGASLRDAVAEGSRCGSLNASLLQPGRIKKPDDGE
ncbi:MAG: hypothetical protein B6D68_02380 [spirochete symbiont of Stewartia floridana]|nr:MAG: hypothetical protein B6D68_02380 [spirochete symbiont of Stewartia floridana]